MSVIQTHQIQAVLQDPFQVHTTFASLYLRAVILAMFSYNFVLTLDDEIFYVWLKPFSFGTGFYVVGRYLAAISVLYAVCKSGFLLMVDSNGTVGECGMLLSAGHPVAPGPCKVFVEFYLRDDEFPFGVLFYTSEMVAVCAMVVLQLRTYALYSKNKWIMGLFCVLNVIVVVFFVFQRILYSRVGTPYTPLFWAPFVLNELVTFSLVAYKYWKLRNNLPMPDHKGSASSDLANVIVRDNMIYFSIIFFAYLAGPLLFVDGELSIALESTHLLGSVAISGIIAPNLFLSLRKGYYEQSEQGQAAMIVSEFRAAVPSGGGPRFSYAPSIHISM